MYRKKNEELLKKKGGQEKFNSDKLWEKGITLISLIVTVIVLLILAGVTINLTLGDNAIFRVAEQAARNYKDAEEKELGLLETFTNSVNKTVNDLQYELLKSKAKPGDYVQYYGGNGYTGLWQILYNDSVYGLQIISSTTVTDSFPLGGDTDEAARASYNDAVNILNNECRKYVNTKYTENENSGRCVGSNPLNPNDSTTKTVTLSFKYNETNDSGMKEIDSMFLTDFDAMKNAVSQNADGIKAINKYYWLASRYSESYANDAYFRIRFTNTNGTSNAGSSWYVTKSGSTTPEIRKYGLRPVIMLLENIKTSNGDGTKENPYVLVEKN